MKFKSKKNISLLSINQGDVILKEITNDGFYEYEVNYKISAQKSLLNKVNLVKILASINPLKASTINILHGNSIEEITNNILLKKSNEKDINRANSFDIISEINSDITKKIPNTKTQSLLGSPIVSKQTSMQLMKSSDITKQNIVLPILETNILKINNDLQNNRKIKDLSFDLIKRSIDPASIFGARTNNGWWTFKQKTQSTIFNVFKKN